MPNARARLEVCLAMMASDSLLVVAPDSFQGRKRRKGRKRKEEGGKRERDEEGGDRGQGEREEKDKVRERETRTSQTLKCRKKEKN